MVLGGLVIHPRDRATDLLNFYRSFTQSAPDELAAYAALMHTPDGQPVAADRGLLQRRPRARASGCWRRCARSARRSSIAIQPMPLPVMQTLLDAAVPDGNQNYWKSTFLRELSDEAIDVIVSTRTRRPRR